MGSTIPTRRPWFLIFLALLATLLVRTDANGSTYYHADGAGNITALMDGDQNIVARYLYGGFGKPLGQWGAMAPVNEMRFSTMPYYSNAGIVGYPGRFYDPNLQRWLSQDPIGEIGGINLYQFAGNSPANFVDPQGLDIYDFLQKLSDFNDGLLTTPIAPEVQEGEAAAEEIAAAAEEGGKALKSLLNAAESEYDAYKAGQNAEKALNAKKACPKKSPPPNGGNAKPHGGPQHNSAIDDAAAKAQANKAENIRKNQTQTDVNGNNVGNNRPDLQYDLNGTHYNVEFDTTAASSEAHQEVLPENDPTAVNLWVCSKICG